LNVEQRYRLVYKPVIFIASLIPFAWLLCGAFGLFDLSLGADPVKKLEHECGKWALNFLLITLLTVSVLSAKYVGLYDQVVGGPVFVIGLPRTGTTALSRPEHNPIPVCSHENSQRTRSTVDERRFRCGRTRGAVAPIPQITSLHPGRPRGDPRDCSRQQRIVWRVPAPCAYQQI